MTRIYEETRYDKEADALVHVANWSFTVYPGSSEQFTVCKNGVAKTVRVEDCGSEFVYKLLKTKIKAQGGAHGLFERLDQWLSEKFEECHAWKVLRWCFDTCRPL